VKKVWDNIIGDSDINRIKDEVYSALKDYIYFPKLRKEYPGLESESNTSFQTSLFDLLSEQNELYDFYCDEDIFIRSSELPLSNSLENIRYIMKDFSEEDIDAIAKYKWYASDIIEEEYYSLI
jgi:hypothetical protein